jgi:hypothetical protein
MHYQIRKAIKTRAHFPDEQAATKAHLPRHPTRRDQVAIGARLDKCARRHQDPHSAPGYLSPAAYERTQINSIKMNNNDRTAISV